MTKAKTIKELLIEGRTCASLVEEGYKAKSVRKAMSEIENGYGVGKIGRKKGTPNTNDVSQNASAFGTDAQYQALAIAIIKTALADLTSCYKYEIKHHNSVIEEDGVCYSAKDLENWFMNEAPMLTNIDPSFLIKVAREKAKYHPRGRYKTKKKARDSYTTTDHRRKEYRNG